MFRFFKRTKTKCSYPLDVRDASSGENLKVHVPPDQLYTVGPFYCDTSPGSHAGVFRHAIDFVVKDGSLVHAVKSGIVIDVVEHHTEYGKTADFADKLNYITIQHDNFLTQYAHLKKGSPSTYGIHKGKQVMRGQVIGIVGKTGWVDFGPDGDHLHFMAFIEKKGGFDSIPVQFE